MRVLNVQVSDEIYDKLAAEAMKRGFVRGLDGNTPSLSMMLRNILNDWLDEGKPL